MNKRVLLHLILFVLIFGCDNIKDEKQVPFEKLSSDVTGIKFSNIITPDLLPPDILPPDTRTGDLPEDSLSHSPSVLMSVG